MPGKEIEGDWVMGWPDRKRPTLMHSTDAEGRVIYGRTPVLDLEGLITPTDVFFIVAQLQMPEPVHPDDYIFSVGGLVDRPAEYTLDDLRGLPGKTVRAVTECAGNDGAFFDYHAGDGDMEKPSLSKRQPEGSGLRGSVPLDDPNFDLRAVLDATPSTGLLSGGEWTGVPLAELLDRAGIKTGAVSVYVAGWDRGRIDPLKQYRSVGSDDFDIVDPGEINFDKALPMAKALHPDTILAWAHNGEYLTHVHGAPLRLIVPGWAGNWWVKWIEKIEVMDHMPACYHQTHYFVKGQSQEDPDKEMMTALGVKTLIKYPRDEDSPIEPGSHVVRGLAWSGAGKVVGVEVSVDSGETWADAHVEDSPDKWLWVRWSYLWEVDAPGAYSIMARATDEQGRVQPQTEWNFQRKHFDGIIPMDVVVEA
jgi:DMSO/TMAO reductase YedYZ molybdopterin-dependent catalytic subunit